MANDITIGDFKLLCRYIIQEQEEFWLITKRVYNIFKIRRERPVSMDSSKLQSFYQPLENAYKEIFGLMDHFIQVQINSILLVTLYEEDKFEEYEDDALLSEKHVDALRKYVNETTVYKENQRIALMAALRKLYDLEIKKSNFFYSTQPALLHTYPEKKPYDKIHKKILQSLMLKWDYWIKVNKLVMQRDPAEMLTLDRFLDYTDLFYLMYWKIYMELKKSRKNVHPVFRELLQTTLDLGFPGSESLFKAGLNSYNEFDLINGVRWSPYKMANDTWNDSFKGTFFSGNVYRKLILNCLRQLVPETLELYVTMRRMCVYYIIFIVGRKQLPKRMAELLSGPVGLDFSKCLELLRRSTYLVYKSAGTPRNDLVLQRNCAKFVVKLLSENEGFAETFFRNRDLCMLKMLRELYERNVAKAKNDYATFVLRAARIMSSLGYNFSELDVNIRTIFKSVYVGLLEFLEINRRGIAACGNVEDRKLVKYVQSTNYFTLQKLQRVALTTLNRMDRHRRFAEVKFETVWMGLPMTEEIREIAYPITKVESYNGWCPQVQEIVKFKHLDGTKKEMTLFRRPSEKNFDSSDQFMNDEQFRSLFPHISDLMIVNPYM